jgi:cellulose synthase/poly-beta-1,6-N-acetylglucosamine synthase-like glycosyltransferase
MVASESTPFISIIVPVFNAARTLPALLESLVSLDYPDSRREVLVVDNGSTDSTPQIAGQHPICFLEEREVLTSYGARNSGARHAKGDLLAFTDGDCIAAPDWLSKLMVGMDDQRIGLNVGEVIGYRPDTPIARLTEETGIMAHRHSLDHKSLQSASTANMLVRRQVWDRLGGFNVTLPAFGDMEFCWRMQIELGLTVGYRPEAMVYHQHRGSYRALWRQALRHGWGSAYMHHHYASYYALSAGENAGRIGALLRAIVVGKLGPGPDPDRWHRPRFLTTWYAGLFFGYVLGRLGWTPSFRYKPERTR